MDYQSQLVQKQQNYRQFVDELFAEIKQLYKQNEQESQEKAADSFFFDWLENMQQIPMDFIRSHSQVNGYRNKCEFSVGRDGVVGFRLDTYKRGSLKVISPGDDCPILNKKTVKLARDFENFVHQSDLPPADNETETGNWKSLTVRTTSSGCLVIVHINSADLEPAKLDEAKKALVDFFSPKDVTSLYMNSGSGRTELLFGNSCISEVMGDKQLKFRISPYSFFQINVRAAEICYNTVGELLQLNQDVFLLDVCCGTGTIGLYLAHQIKKVFGVEINKEAIKDAKQNAETNGITNAEFVDGNTEQKISGLIQRAVQVAKKEGISDPEIVAILDPPRAGLRK